MKFNDLGGESKELIYFFLMVDSNEKFISSTMNREESNKYIPKSIQNQRLILPKINDSFKKLIEMEKPIRFLMETDEVLTQEGLKRFESLIETIKEQGYNLENKGTRPDGKYFWTFSTESQEVLGEQYEKRFFELKDKINRKKMLEEGKPFSEMLRNRKKGLL
ncbi:hypothetical protein COB55_03870 [Candidatus Wolfebacteria bacterium]|nr:MAG: hypothetical protein COB55_03870 [Candidatus Wolfebacteria bacterium]